MVTGIDFIWWHQILANQKMVVYTYNVGATIAQIGMSCKAYHYCSSQGSHWVRLMIRFFFFPLVACIELSSTMKIILQRWSLCISTSLVSPCSITQVCGDLQQSDLRLMRLFPSIWMSGLWHFWGFWDSKFWRVIYYYRSFLKHREGWRTMEGDGDRQAET